MCNNPLPATHPLSITYFGNREGFSAAKFGFNCASFNGYGKCRKSEVTFVGWAIPNFFKCAFTTSSYFPKRIKSARRWNSNTSS